MDLPPEILHIIFSFCSETDLLGSLQYVCRKWHEAALSPWMWKERILHVSGHENSEELKSLLPFLKKVSMQNMNSEAVTFLSENWPQLEYLCINVCDHSVFLHNQISQFDCLTHIDVTFQKMFRLDGITHFNPNSRFPPLLRTIIFRKAVSDVGFPLFLLQTCEFLQCIIITHVNELERFLESSLKNSGFTNKPGEKCTLHTFYLSLINGHAMEKILEKISEFCNLKYLALKFNRFHDNDILETIFKKPRPELVFLDLGHPLYLTTDTFASVINACPNLEYLSLERCNVTDCTVLVILSKLSRLRCLNLHGTFITSQHFSSIPVKLPNLQDLNVCACRRIDKDVLNGLVIAMPNLIIVPSRMGILKGALAMGRHHSFLEHRNSLIFFEFKSFTPW